MAISSNNFVNLIGHLGDDPVVKTLPSGTALTEFSLATNSSYTNKEGTRISQTEWHRIKAYGGAAEVLSRYLHRGSKVSILGTIHYNKWVDKNEQNRTNTNIIVESFSFLDSANSKRDQSSPAGSRYANEPMDNRANNRRAAPSRMIAADESAMPDANKKVPF